VVSEKQTLYVKTASRNGIVSGTLRSGRMASAQVSADEADRLIREIANSGPPTMGNPGPTTEITTDQIISVS
jgi:hypothetical protein